MPYKNKADRNYDHEYESYQGSEQQKKNRAQRNAARRKLLREGKVRKGDGMDVAHTRAIDKGGSTKDGVRVESKAKNRSFRRDSKGNLTSERSKREAK